jgi:hypothetical protein
VVIHGPELAGEQYVDVPPELSSCFTRPAPEQDWLGPPARPPSDGRRRRAVPGGELLGFLVVDDEEVYPAAEVREYGAELRAARRRRPRFAFGSSAVEVLESSLERAEPAFAWCYQRALQDHPELSGRVAMRVAAPDGSGSVDGAGTDVEDVELRCCLSNAQRLWTARVRGNGELRYVLDLRRGR